MDKLLGFLPDADPTLPGVITLCENIIPYEYGLQGSPTGLTPDSVTSVIAADWVIARMLALAGR
jgi:hypothetical protein